MKFPTRVEGILIRHSTHSTRGIKLNHNLTWKIISFLLSNVTSSILLKTLFSVIWWSGAAVWDGWQKLMRLYEVCEANFFLALKNRRDRIPSATPHTTLLQITLLLVKLALSSHLLSRSQSMGIRRKEEGENLVFLLIFSPFSIFFFVAASCRKIMKEQIALHSSRSP